MAKDRYWKQPNYRVVIKYTKGALYDGAGWSKDLEDAKAMFKSVVSKLTRKKLEKAELYFENRLIKKL